ncbi:MAG: methyltransferase type 11 [Bacteroidetes bacterium]|nr:methyltransferase type 11 [Bacteroidota bacterium]
MKIFSKKAQIALNSDGGIKLNLGAGDTFHNDMLNVDIRPLKSTDIVADLNEKLDLIPAKSVTEIYSRHTFEHIDNLELLLSEIKRICMPGAKLTIIVPHFSNPFGFSDPTHKRFFGIYSFCYYSKNSYFKRRNKFPKYNESIDFFIDNISIRFYRNTWVDRFVNPFLEWVFNKTPLVLEFYEYRISYIWPAWEIKFNLIVE